jgi:UDP-glucose 4-epimerase
VTTLANYALTGSTGLLGTALSNAVSPQNVYTGDVRDADQIMRWVHGLKNVDALIHLAALVPKQRVDQETKQAFDINVGGTLNILDALRRMKELGQNTPWLFYASTSHVYAPALTPMKEDSHREPFTLYGLTKLQGEQWCEAYVREYDLPICTGRIFSFSDKCQPHYYFLPAMFNKIKSAEMGATLTISGVQGHRDFLRISQICEAILFLEKEKYRGQVNIGTGVAHKLSDLVLRIAQLLNRDDLEFVFPESPGQALIADNSLLKSLGLPIECEIDELLSEMAKA